MEGAARAIVHAELQRRVDARVRAMDDGAIGALVRLAAAREAEQVAAMRARLREGIDRHVAAVAEEMRDPACACRITAALAARNGEDWRTALVGGAEARLTAMIRAQYLDVAARLMCEFRVFTAANALVLLFLGIAVAARRNARVHLLPPAVILTTGAAVTAYLYLFAQDWLHTILYGDYVGLAYVPVLGAASLFLADILLNRARVTARTINAVAHVFGGAAAALPC